jgi:phosphoglucosamine mutase
MKLFGTDGIRGRAGEFPLDPASVRRLGETLGRLLAGTAARRVVLGGDTRESTPGLIAELAAGLSAAGCATAFGGTLTTPGVAEVVLGTHAAAGISVSASHNPFEDNGIKIFGPDGRKLADVEEERIEKEILAGRGAEGGRERRGEGAISEVSPSPTPPLPPSDPNLAELYLTRLAEHVPVRLSNIDIVIDAGNGAAYRLGPEALERAGAHPRPIQDVPDGRNINHGCGALHPEGMARVTRESGAAMGVAFDGDADRAIFADETGRVLDGDDILWIIATDWKRKGILAAGGVVGTIMSNFGLEAAFERERIPFRRAAVGDRSVARMMDESGSKLGGETSGHVLLPFSPAGDGIQTALIVASIAVESGKPLSGLATLEKVPQILRNIRVARRAPLEGISSIARAVESARAKLDHRGRVFLRYSGTEPLLRILVEGRDGDEVLRIADDLEAAVRAELE